MGLIPNLNSLSWAIPSFFLFIVGGMYKTKGIKLQTNSAYIY